MEQLHKILGCILNADPKEKNTHKKHMYSVRKWRPTSRLGRASPQMTPLGGESVDGGYPGGAPYRTPSCSSVACGFAPFSPSSPHAGGCCLPCIASAPGKVGQRERIKEMNSNKTIKTKQWLECALTLCLRLSFLFSSVSWSIFSFHRSKKYDGSE